MKINKLAFVKNFSKWFPGVGYVMCVCVWRLVGWFGEGSKSRMEKDKQQKYDYALKFLWNIFIKSYLSCWARATTIDVNTYEKYPKSYSNFSIYPKEITNRHFATDACLAFVSRFSCSLIHLNGKLTTIFRQRRVYCGNACAGGTLQIYL